MSNSAGITYYVLRNITLGTTTTLTILVLKRTINACRPTAKLKLNTGCIQDTGSYNLTIHNIIFQLLQFLFCRDFCSRYRT
jgi:hypothetical protein